MYQCRVTTEGTGVSSHLSHSSFERYDQVLQHYININLIQVGHDLQNGQKLFRHSERLMTL